MVTTENLEAHYSLGKCILRETSTCRTQPLRSSSITIGHVLVHGPAVPAVQIVMVMLASPVHLTVLFTYQDDWKERLSLMPPPL